MILGIDASNINSGGGLNHLVNLLNTGKYKKHGFKKIIVWSKKSTLNKINNKKNIIKKSHFLLEKMFLIRIFWNLFFQKCELEKENCDALLVLGGYLVIRFSPVISISQNLLLFEKKEMKNYGLRFMRLKLLILRLLQINTFNQADGLIFLTNYAKNIIMPHLSAKPTCKVIPHGINKNFYLKKRPIKKISNYSNSNPFRILYVSHIDFYKHQWHVVDAVSSLIKKGYPLQLDLVGDGYSPAIRKLKKKISSSKSKNIFYKGQTDNNKLHKYYEKANLFVFASSCENLPIILLEAMASKTPIVSSSKGPMREILGSGFEYFDPYKPRNISKVIEKVIKSEKKRNDLLKKAYTISKKYKWDYCGDKTFNFISEVIEKK